MTNPIDRREFLIATALTPLVPLSAACAAEQAVDAVTKPSGAGEFMAVEQARACAEGSHAHGQDRRG